MVRAVEALERARYHDAAALFRHAAQLDRGSLHAWLGLGIASTHTLDTATAEDALERAIELAPMDFFPRLRLAELYLRIGLPTKAHQALDRAMELSRDSAERRMVRELVAVDKSRGARRIWRPDFTKAGYWRRPR
ncbi:MAG: tetratricopeptide repeat protein [Candidatus Binataceae bacterium]